MHSPSSVTAASTTAILLILVSVTFSPCYSQLEDESYYTCVHNFNFSCGQDIQNVRYPFWGGDRPQFCGHPSFELKCRNEYPTIEINKRDFHVLRIDQSNNTMTLASSDLWESYCTQELHNITWDDKLFPSGHINQVLFLFYNCTLQATAIEIPRTFPCKIGGVESHGIYADETRFNETKNSLSASCTKSVEVQVLRETMDKLLKKSLTLQEGLHIGFEVEYDVDEAACARCEGSGGICGSDSSEFVCHCRDRTDPVTCQSTGDGRNVGRKLVIVHARKRGKMKSKVPELESPESDSEPDSEHDSQAGLPSQKKKVRGRKRGKMKSEQAESESESESEPESESDWEAHMPSQKKKGGPRTVPSIEITN